MKLKPYIQGRIYIRKFSAISIFLAVMAAMTIVSRAADSFMVPQVSIASPEEMKLKYPLEIQGSITAKEKRAIYCQEGARIAQVQVYPGDIVKKGDLLFSIDKDYLQSKIQQTELEIKKLNLQIKDLEESYQKQASQQTLNINRTNEDYTDISSASEASVNAAYLELENARNELDLHESQKPAMHESGNASNEPVRPDSQKPTMHEPENDSNEPVQLDSQKTAMHEPGNDSNEPVQPDSQKTTMHEPENDSNEPVQLDSQKTEENIEQDQEDPLDAWVRKHAELEQACLEKQKLYEEAVAAKNEAIKAAVRQIEDANQPIAKDNSAALLQIEKTNLAQTLQELEKLSQAEGNVYSEYNGQISECAISTGSTTSAEPVIILADFSRSFQFEGTLDDSGENSAENLLNMEGTLKMKYGNALYEHVKISGISQEENGTCRITADLDSNETFSPGEAILNIARESRQYPCCIPLSAIYSQESGDFVIRIQEASTILGIQSTAEYVPVTLLEKNDQYAAVEGNLSSSDRIIVNASKTIKEGDRIRIIED